MTRPKYPELRDQALEMLSGQSPKTTTELARSLHVDSKILASVMNGLRSRSEVAVAGTTAKGRCLWKLADEDSAKPATAADPPCDPDIASYRDAEHRDWMTFWRRRWDARQAHRNHVYLMRQDLPEPPRPEPCDTPAPYLVTQPQPVWDHEGD